ncbi:MAG: rhomboid family intramembrane serine protease [Desulfovibrio sp.]|nr:rhomboid family intramembrane serine protease [Desulfovibrio sp.]
MPERRLNAWLLVLEAKKIPHVFFSNGEYPSIYIPALYEEIALHEIRSFEGERDMPIAAPPAGDNMAGVLLFLSLIVIWHAARWGWLPARLPSPPFPPVAQDWAGMFGLDVYRARSLHEWWRTVTALTLHADGPHLAGNVTFGLFFCILLCRRAGLGLGIALTVAAGVLGNAGNALTREAYASSLGFSTALFGAMGSLCALAAIDSSRHCPRSAYPPPPVVSSSGASGGGGGVFSALLRRLAMPLAAGMALLGITGGSGEARVDYAAHIWGFCCGLLCAVASLPFERALFALDSARRAASQAILFVTSLAAVVGAWCYALLIR